MHRRAAQQRDERASFQLIEAYSVPVSQGRIAGYRIGEESPAFCNRSAGRGPLWIKMRKTRIEHMLSDLPPIADISE
jgi:hypothetical protein